MARSQEYYKLGDLYFEKKELGKGAYGKVYKGFLNLPHAQRYEVAVKEITKLKIKQKPEMLQREIQTMCRVVSDNVVKLFFVEETKRAYFFVMEYCSGGDLKTAIQASPLSEAQAREYFRDIVDGVNIISQAGIVHRDLKPDNIMLSSKSPPIFAKIADFGLAREYDQDQMGITPGVGTPIYAAPEVIQNQKNYEKSDVWSLGCILYEILTQTKAFQAASIPDLQQKHLKGYENLTFGPQISECAKDLLKNLLRYDISERYEVKQILNHPFLGNQPYVNISLTSQPTVEELQFCQQLKSARIQNINNVNQLKQELNASDFTVLCLYKLHQKQILEEIQKTESAMSTSTSQELKDELTICKQHLQQIDSQLESLSKTAKIPASQEEQEQVSQTVVKFEEKLGQNVDTSKIIEVVHELSKSQ